MKIECIVFVLASAVFGVQGQSSLGACTRPDGTAGMCIPYQQCPEIVQMLNSTNRNSEEIRKYACGFDETTPKVCCNYDCYTPEGNLGNCQSIEQCPHLYQMIQSNDKNSKAYVKNSRCLAGKRSVCCGPRPSAGYDQVVEECQYAMNAFPPHPASECCGVDANSASKIFGGNNTAIDEYPWLALLEYKRTDGKIKTYCGGALISSRYVVTAAHCITGPGAWPPINVRLGEFDTSTSRDCVGDDCNDPPVTIKIQDIIVHPAYNTATSRNDIALIRLATPAPYTDFVRPICLPDTDITHTTNLEVFAAGWGKMNESTLRSKVKQHVKLPMVKTVDCQKRFDGRMTTPPKLWSYQLCAGGEAGKDACNGDSGGPLMLKTDNRYDMVGVVSFGLKACGTQGLPGIYTNVYPYISFIRRNLRP